MVKKRSFSKYLKFLLFTLVILQMVISVNLNGQQIYQNSNITNDTLFVYDTVWVYEAVYDTIWVFDTIYIASIFKPLEKLKPIEVSQINYSTNYSLTAKTLTSITLQRRKYVHRQIKNNKFNFNLKQKKNKSKKKRHSTRYAGKLTLNPTKGKFDPRLFSRGIFSTEAFVGTVLQNTQYAYPTNSENLIDIEKAIENMSGIEYGARINYNLFQYTLQCGIGISQLKESFNYIQTDFDVYSTQQSTEISYMMQWTDTLRFYDIDQLIGGDTTWITYYDTYDTLIIEDSIFYNYDTTFTQTQKSEINSHYLLEIPLIFSYEWGFAKTAIQLKLGGVNQFHMFSKGKAFSGTGMVEDINQTTNFTKYNFAVYGGIGFLFDFSQKVSIAIDAYYKYPLKKYSTSNSAVLNKQTYGINAAIRYHF